MALYDWNHNGKRDIGDDFIEYQIYNEVMNEDNAERPHRSSGNGLSWIGIFVCMFLGIAVQAVIYTAFDIDIDRVPVVLMIVLWIFFTFVFAYLAEKLFG